MTEDNYRAPERWRMHLVVVVFVAITVPLMVHTAQLLLLITHIEPRWLAYLYAGFFALGFDLAVFMFSLYDLKGAKKTFAVMAGVVGFFFFNLEILFEELPANGWANGKDWASVVLGTMFAVVGAYLVYHSTELINQVFAVERFPVEEERVRAGRQAERRTTKEVLNYKHTPGRPPAPAPAKEAAIQINRSRIAERAVSIPPMTDPLPPPPDIKTETIAQLKEEGLTNAEIADQLGCSEKTVYRRLKKLEAV